MKQKTTHLFEEHVYLISNHSVARNPMFADEKMQDYFIAKMEKYLFPISEIIAHCLNDHEFQLLVRLKPREDFEEHFISKQKDQVLHNEIPESTYIFSQAMANLQVSFVKHFNHKYDRNGTLVAARFGRELIETETEMRDWIKKLNSGLRKHNYAAQWSNNMMSAGFAATSSWLYGGAGSGGRIGIAGKLGYLNGEINNLGASFKNLPPYRLPSSKSFFLKQILRIFRQNQSILE